MKLVWWLGAAAALALTAIGDVRFVAEPERGFLVAKWWWLAALVSLLLGCIAADFRTARPAAPAWRRNDVLALITIVLVATAFRLWGITSYPPPHAFGFEEYQTGGNAYHTYVDWSWTPEFPLTNFLPGLFFRIFGLSSYSLRAPFILSGILAPVFLFLALRQIVVLPAAWGAALLLSCNRWAASAARFADEIFFPISVAAASAWLVVCVVKRRGCTTAFLLGLVSADLFYAYTGYRIYPLLGLALAVLLSLWRRYRTGIGTDAWRRIVTVALVWLVMTSLGFAQFAAVRESVFFEALRRHTTTWSEQHSSAVQRLSHVAEHLRGGLEFFATNGEVHPWVNDPPEPMFDPATAVLVAIAVLWGIVRIRDRWRGAALTLLVVPFVTVGFFATNFNGERYFVFLIPMFALIGFLFGDIVTLKYLRGRVGLATLVIVAAMVLALNVRAMQRLMTAPVVQNSFRSTENLVLGALSEMPPGSRAVLLTVEGANAMEPSDYRFLTEDLQGGRAASLSTAFTVDTTAHEPFYWVVEGQPEAELLANALSLICPTAQTELRDGELGPHAVAVGVAKLPSECRPLPPVGWQGTYTTTTRDGEVSTEREVVPFLGAYSIPWAPISKLVTEQVQRLDASWAATLRVQKPGHYRFWLSTVGATAELTLADKTVHSDGKDVAWVSEPLEVDLAAGAVPIGVSLRAERPIVPRVRVLWESPGQARGLIEPTLLEPVDSQHQRN